MAYFTIMQGLRGCYMPDSAYIAQINTRRELKATLESEAYYLRDAGAVGLSKRHIAWLANAAWKGRKCGKEYCAPYRRKGQNYYPYGLSVTSSSRADYLESLES